MRKRAGKSGGSSSNRSTTTRRSTSQRQRTQQGEEQNEGSGLHELFLEELADIYNAEQQLTKALPKMAKAAQSEELRMAFEEHLGQTEEQISRLDQVFESLGETPRRKTCKAMQGLVEEGSEVMQEHKGSPEIDAALIAAAQKVEHYEIASYGTLCTWAEQMGHDQALELLKETIDEEETTDERLTELAEGLANLRAEQE
jgi:ferritin-like metal-binding protein YciE